MFLGVTSSRSSGPSCWRRHRLRNATATARFASSCPTMCSFNAATIALGVSLSFSTWACSPPLWGMVVCRFILPAMSGAPVGTSSGTAEGGEEALLVAHDLVDLRRLRRRIPLVELERAAQKDAVGPRE